MSSKALSLIAKIKFKKNEAAKQIIDEVGANMPLPDGSPIIYATLYDNNEIFDYIIDQDIDVNALYENDYSPLMAAARNGNLHMLAKLLKKDVDVNLRDKHGNTALFEAIFFNTNNLPLIQLLLDKGADPNIKNYSGIDPYEFVVQIGVEETVNLLENYMKIKI